MNYEMKLLKHQAEFIEDTTTKYLALVGGYGCGKSKALAMKAITLAALNCGFMGAVLSPTFGMATKTIMPALEECLDELNIKYKKQKSAATYTLKFPGGRESVIYILSAENHNRLRGMNLAWWCVDEMDTIDRAIADAAFKQLSARLRVGPNKQGAIASTPEGFKWLYNFLVTEANDKDGNPKTDRRMIKAKTRDNPFLEEDYIQSLLDTYPSNLISAYLEGEFVNLEQGSVYYAFDRIENATTLTIEDFSSREYVPHVGVDFNVGKTSAAIFFVKDNEPYFVHEITDALNTEDLIRKMNVYFLGWKYTKVYVYPDASGANRSSKTSMTDLQLLQQWHYTVMAKTQNPRVKDRVGSVNTMVCNALGKRRFHVNPKTCPKLVEALEKQAYTKKGEPDKTSGFDHVLDAMGYGVSYLWPMKSRSGGTVEVR